MTAEPHPVTLAAKRAGCAAAAAAIAAAATNPVETLRVKWQVLKPAEKSVLAFATRLAEREGFARGLALPGLGAWMVAMGGAFGGRVAPMIEESLSVLAEEENVAEAEEEDDGWTERVSSPLEVAQAVLRRVAGPRGDEAADAAVVGRIRQALHRHRRLAAP